MDYQLNDKQLVKLFDEKEKELKQGRALEKKKNVIEEAQRKIGLKLNRLKEQMIPIVEKKREELGITEFEEITTLKVVKGKVVLSTTDLIEDYKRIIREQRGLKNEEQTDDTDKKDAVKTDEPAV